MSRPTLRIDLHLPNQANGWSITSGSLNGRLGRPFASPQSPIPDSSEWKREVLRGTMIPIELTGGAPLNVRVIVRDALTEAERASRVGGFAWKLCVPDGVLVLAGGAEHIMYGRDEAAFMAPHLRTVEVPPGDYLVEVHTLVASPNASPPSPHDDVQSWWEATRKGEPLPDWIGCERDWHAGDEAALDFIVQLSPLIKAPSRPKLNELGWFPADAGSKPPKRCPDAIVSREVRGLPERREEPRKRGLRYRHDVFGLWGETKTAPVDPEPLGLPVPEIACAYWIGSFLGPVHPELRVTGAAGFEPDWSAAGELVEATRIGADGWLVEFDGESSPTAKGRALSSVGALLATLPDGARVELATGDRSSGRKRGAGWLLLRGTVRNGTWVVDHAHPPVDHATLDAEVGLVREAMAGGVRFRDPEEEKRLSAKLRRDIMFATAPAVIRDGRASVQPGEEVLLPCLAELFFKARFKGGWPGK